MDQSKLAKLSHSNSILSSEVLGNKQNSDEIDYDGCNVCFIMSKSSTKPKI